jgi:hypothetical protein
MFDVSQKDVGYRSLQWGGYICVPSYVDNPQMVGETLDVLAFYSRDVSVTFYEKMLGKKIADVPEDAKMLDDYIWNNVCTDFGQTYCDYSNSVLYFLPRVTRAEEDGGKPLASYYASIEASANKSFSKFVAEVINNKSKYNGR